MKMIDEARPSEKEATEMSELSLSGILVEESKKKEKTLMLSSDSVELVVVGMEVKNITAKKGTEKKWN